MPRYTGNDGYISVDGDAVGNLKGWSLEITGDEIDVAAMGDTARVRLPGKPNVSGSISVWFDDADAGQANLVQGTEVALELRPRGVGSGLPEFTIPVARISGETYPGDVDAGLPADYTFTADALPDRTAQA
jgi:hypothetical protein